MTTNAQSLAQALRRMGVTVTVTKTCHGCRAVDAHIDVAGCCFFGYAIEQAPDGRYVPSEGIVLCPNPVTDAQFEMRRHEYSATVPLVEELAKDIHAAYRDAYERHFAKVYEIGPDPMAPYVSWEDLSERVREGRRAMARALLRKYRLVAADSIR